MVGKRLGSRVKAAVIGAVMTASVFISPAAFQFSKVTAADLTVNHKFTTTDSTADDASNKAKIDISSFKGASTITLNFETTYTGEITVGTYGNEISKDPWWVGADTTPKVENQEFKATAKNGKFSIVYQVPSSITNDIKTVGLGIWYPKDGTVVTLTTASAGGTVNPNPGPGEQEKPETQNAKSGSWSFTDNKDGTATISSTLTAEIDDQEMDFLLTKGYDEEGYLDEEGKNTWKEGDPINSHKFKFSEFGLENLDSIRIQSFNYTITSDEEMSKFMYGGGINVEPQSPADTEYVKGKNGYWYNDQGDEDMEQYGDQFEITVNNGYTVQNAGTYAEIVWDVPADVQEYVTKNLTDTVGFQFWYAQAANPPEGEDYAEVEEVHLKAASCTYTRTMTVPYRTGKTINKKVGQKLTAGSDEATNQYKFNLKDLGLENRDLVSAVKFNVTSSADLKKFTGGVGISVANGNSHATDGWYMPASNITVLEPGKKFEIMWIIPDSIRKDVDVLSEDGNLMFGAWYAGEDAPTITLDSIDFYEFISNEEDLSVVPEKLELTVGETHKLTTNVSGCKYISSNPSVATAENDVVSALAKGQTNILVRSPEGQEVTITVTVKDKVVVTTAPVTTTAPVKTTTKIVTTTTTPVTTVPEPTEEPIDWDKVLYGDVNVDGKITIADVVALNMYLLNNDENKLSATGKENAQCVYDGVIDTNDSALLINYVAMLVPVEDLGPQD